MSNGARNVFTPLGASNHSEGERDKWDYYATEPYAVELLMDKEEFSDVITEPCCGEGHISKVLIQRGKKVHSFDLIDRGFGDKRDFFSVKKVDGDIITNPPYGQALKFVEQAINTIGAGHKVAMFLRLQFLEGQARGRFFKEFPPTKVLVASKRLQCAKNGEFEKFKGTALAHAWFIWEKDGEGNVIKQAPTIDWIGV